MATLTGNAINTSYQGLIKTDDNAAFGAAEKRVTDGLGNATNMTIGTGGTSFDSGTVNFTGATVTGLPGGSAGLVAGTGADSMQSAASLTTVAANASGENGIALGDGAEAITGPDNVSIGTGAHADGDKNVAIGKGAIADGSFYGSVAIGSGAKATANNSAIAIAGDRDNGATASGTKSIAIGQGVQASGLSSTAIGFGSSVTAGGGVALGCGVTAAKADTVSVKELETQTAGGGIYLTTPDGLAQPKLTVDNSSNLLIGGNPVGAAGLESGTGTDSMQSAASLTTVAADASGTCSIAIGDGARGRLLQGSIGIGKSADGHEGGVAIGYEAKGLYGGIGIGCQADGGFNTAEQVIIGAFSKGCSKPYATTLGACSVVNADNGLALGANTLVSAADAVALGKGVTAAKADTVTVKELETCVAGGGITLKSADLTEEKMTLTDADVLAVGGDTIPANDSATPTVVNRIWSGSQAQYDALGTYDANTLYYIA